MRKLLAFLAVAIFAILLAGLLMRSKPQPHHVDLSWKAPIVSPSSVVTGYSVYRSTSPSGPFVKIAAQVTGTSYSDWLVVSGRTYYYVVTTTDTAGKESRYSNETTSVVP